MQKITKLLRDAGLAILRALGTTVTDARTGRSLGRAFIFSWRGTIRVIGLETPVIPIFLPQTRLTYWKQDIGFTRHPAPDFPRCGKDA